MISFAIDNTAQHSYISQNDIPAIVESIERIGQTDLKVGKFKKEESKETSLTNKIQTLEENNETEKITLTGYSQNYKAHNLEILTSKILDEVSLWEDAGNLNGLIYVSNIKDLLDEYQNYYLDDSESRIFFSLVGLIFESNMWENLNNSQIKQLKMELQRYNRGKLDEKEVRKFLKQLYRENLLLLGKI